MDANFGFLLEGNKRDGSDFPHGHITQRWQQLLPLWTAPFQFNTGSTAPCSLANKKAQCRLLSVTVPKAVNF